ncbi:MAG: phage/plasmid primase, P4 family [Bacilli bacterium]|nr:phage/plasmid primase, P4 family [Bacilli bacterium]
MKKIKLHIDSICYTYKPKEFIAAIKTRTQNQYNVGEYSIYEIKDYVERGYTISPGIMRNGIKAENWTEQQLFLIDIDNDIKDCPIITVDEALEICKQKNLKPNFYYYTYSSMEKKPKYRLGFIMEEIVFEENKRRIIQETLTSLFTQSDKSTKNADRIFHGTNKEFIILDESNTITFNDILNNYTPEEVKTTITNMIDNSLKSLIENFDFLSYLKKRNGKVHQENDKYIQFKHCELCGHNNDLTYYFNDKTFFCFSSSLNKGGTIIDYLMALNDWNVKEAIDYFKHTMYGIPRNDISNKYSENDELIKKFQELKIENTYTFDDKGISKLYADTYKDYLRFNTTANEWFYYNGKIWLEDERSMKATSKAEEFADNLLIYASRIGNEDIKSKFLKYITKLGQFKYREILIKDSKDVYCFSNNNLDKNDDLFNCQNGTFNLATFEFKEHNPNDMLSKISNVIYDPKAKADRFKSFINEVLEDDEKVDFVKKILGYSLTTETHIEALYIFLGENTRNGKSTLVETIAYMLGNNKGYAVTASAETIALKNNKDSRAPSEDIARLNNCRFLSVSEPPKNMLLDNALIKIMTGRDTLTARHLQQRQFEFRPKFKLFMNCNHLPLITDETLFLSSRINVITFDRHFTEFEQDPHLKDKLRTEKEISGIFNWCLEGLKSMRERTLIIPNIIHQANDKYRKSSDKICLFMEDCLTKSSTNTKVKDAYDEYKKWCVSNGCNYEGKVSFVDYLRKRNLLVNIATINGKTEKNVLKGYSLVNIPLVEELEIEGI